MYPRFIDSRVDAAFLDTRVVLLAGPRQSGKTTLARLLAGDGMPFLTLDDATTRAGALADPTGFVRQLDRAVIDEVQRCPDLLLAIKASVDADPRPGRFFLTGSANLMTLPRVADSLAGRMEVVRLLPLAQAEIKWARPMLLERLFAGDVPAPGTRVVGEDLVSAVLSGGYPEALTGGPGSGGRIGISIISTRLCKGMCGMLLRSGRSAKCRGCCGCWRNTAGSW